MLLTALIVAGIYLGLLVVIEHPFVVAAERAEVDSQVVQTQVESQKQQPVISKPVAIKMQKAPKPEQLYMPDTTLVGINGAVDLNNAQADAGKLWQRFSEMKALQNNVDWSKGNIVVYAYYHNFNQDFTWADLMIGYDEQDLKLGTSSKKMTIKQGAYQKYIFQAQLNSASDEAWAQAYIHKNLMERHTLNRNGQLVTTDAIVLTR